MIMGPWYTYSENASVRSREGDVVLYNQRTHRAVPLIIIS